MLNMGADDQIRYERSEVYRLPSTVCCILERVKKEVDRQLGSK